MELNWSTFILEIINFLVLVWIMKRFFYKPLLKIIAERRAAIEGQSAEAQRLNEEAVSLKQQYQNRLSDWKQERQQARDTLNQEFENEKARQLEALQKVLTQEKEKTKKAEEHRQIEVVREIEHQALQQGAEFASRLLDIASSPELESRLISLLVNELEILNPQQISLMQDRWGETPEAMSVCSAYPLSKEQKDQIEAAVGRVVGRSLPAEYKEVPKLQAGLHISIGAWVIQANVRDELKGFAEFAHVAR